MVKRRRKSSSKCSEPINTMIDIAGAAAMRSFVKHKIKKDYEKGYGKESAEAAAMAFGFRSLQRGTKGMLARGGIYGINSALNDIEKAEQRKQSVQQVNRQRQRAAARYDDSEEYSYKTNDNRYAWRLNCEDGSAYGIDPQDYETRDQYNDALKMAKESADAEKEGSDDVSKTEKKVFAEDTIRHTDIKGDMTQYVYCRVSRLDNGENTYYLAGNLDLKIGDMVMVPVEDGEEKAVVLSVEQHTRLTAPQAPEETMEIVGKGRDNSFWYNKEEL